MKATATIDPRCRTGAPAMARDTRGAALRIPAWPAVAAVALALLALAACERPGPELPGTRVPLAMGYWAARDRVVVGSYGGGGVAAVDPASKEIVELLPEGANGRQAVVRIAVDDARSRLWVLGQDSLYVYELAGGKAPRLLGEVPVAKSRGGPALCFADLALDARGRAIVSSEWSGRLQEVELKKAGKGHVLQAGERFLAMARNTAIVPDVPKGLSALLAVPGTDTLLAADAAGGGLWRIDRSSWKVERIPVPGGVLGACGLAFAKDPEPGRALELYVAQGFQGGIARIRVQPDFSAASRLREIVPDRGRIFSLARHGDRVYFAPIRIHEGRQPLQVLSLNDGEPAARPPRRGLSPLP